MSRPLHIMLVTPPLVQDFGLMKIDPIKLALGVSLEDLLEDLMTGPRKRGHSPDSEMADLYPMALPDGEGGALPLGDFGELGFSNQKGLLELTVPHGIGQHVWDKVKEHAVEPARTIQTGNSWSAVMLLKLPRGGKVGLQVKGFEFALYAGSEDQ